MSAPDSARLTALAYQTVLVLYIISVPDSASLEQTLAYQTVLVLYNISVPYGARLLLAELRPFYLADQRETLYSI